MKRIAFMPLRGGSKSIPYKNIKFIAGKPLFFWSLAAAFESGVFDQVCVSTDDEKIKQKVMEYLPETIIIDRPPELATDTATTESVMLHFAAKHEFDIISLIQATSPLTKASDFCSAWQKFSDEQLDSLVTGVEWKRFFWQKDGTPVNYDPLNRPMRQQFEGWLMENGAFYFTKREVLMSEKCRLGGKIGIYEMSEENALEIDEPSDWNVIENLLCSNKKGQNSLTQKLEKIKAIVVDVDGTLTDGGMYYDENGEAMKKFNTKDAQGLKMLENAGIMVCVITAEDSPRVHARMKKIGLKNYHYGIKEKLPLLKALCDKWSLSLENIAYVGDDLGDKDCLAAAGFGACPADGEEVVLPVVDYVCKRKGGEGAVREVCEMVRGCDL